ncbi:unnamed protein product [Ixodes hexagonus]
MLNQLAECAAAAAVREPGILTRTMATPPAGTTDSRSDPRASTLVTATTHALTSAAAGDSTRAFIDAHTEKEGRDNSETASSAAHEVSTAMVIAGPFHNPMKASAHITQTSKEALPGCGGNTSAREAAMAPSAVCKLPTPVVATVAGASTQVCNEARPGNGGKDNSRKHTSVSPAIHEIPSRTAPIPPSQDPTKASTQVIQVFTKARSENGSNVNPGVVSSTVSHLPTKVVTMGPYEGPVKILTQTTQFPVQVNWNPVVRPGSRKEPEPKNSAACTKVSPELIVGISTESEKHALVPTVQGETVRFSNTMQMCGLCRKVFSNPSNLRQHYAIVHSTSPERPFGCTVCDKRFNTESNLRQHRRTHTGERPFPCPHCPRAFSTSTNLRQHERIHTGERPFACSDCPRAFSTSSNLRQHQRIHSNERPFECSLCEKRFRSSTNLRQHGKTHNGVVAAIVISEVENDGGASAELTETNCEPKELWTESKRTDETGCPEQSLPRASTISDVEDPTAEEGVHSIMFLQVSQDGSPGVMEVLEGLQSLKEGPV